MCYFLGRACTLTLLVITAFLVPPASATKPKPPHPWEHSEIHRAVFDCSLSQLRDELEKGVDVNRKEFSRRYSGSLTPLEPAFDLYGRAQLRRECPKSEILRELLHRGASLDGKSIKNAVIPIAFADSGSRDELRNLISYGMLFTENPQSDGRLLVQAAVAGNVELLSELLSLGVSSNAIDATGCSSLYRATTQGIEHKRLSVFVALLAAKADPNMQCKNDAPLHRLASFPGADGKDLITLLIKHGADPNAGLKASENRTPLERMVQSSHSTREIADVLVASGAKLTPLLGPLVASSYDRQTHRWVDFLADHGFDMNYIDDWRGGTLLIMALTRGRLDTVQALIRRGSNPALQWHRPASPKFPVDIVATVLHTLPSNDSDAVQALNLLLPYGLDVNAKGTSGATPLLSLQAPGVQPKAMALLLKSGADVRAVDANGRGIVHRLAANRNTTETSPLTLESLRIVANAGGDFNLQDRSGNAPIMLAVRAGALSLISELISLGAKVNVQNSNGITPLHIAAFRGDPYIVEKLLEHGADKNAVSTLGEKPCDVVAFGQFVIGMNAKATLQLLCPPERANNWQPPPPLKDATERRELDQRAGRFNIF